MSRRTFLRLIFQEEEGAVRAGGWLAGADGSWRLVAGRGCWGRARALGRRVRAPGAGAGAEGPTRSTPNKRP